MTKIPSCLTAFFLLMCANAGAEEGKKMGPFVADGWYEATAAKANGKVMVCPPKIKELEFQSPGFCKGGKPMITPQVFLEMVCPGALLVLLNPVRLTHAGYVYPKNSQRTPSKCVGRVNTRPGGEADAFGGR